MANDIIINVLAKAQGKEVNQLYSDIKKVEDEAEKGAKVKLNVDDAVTALNSLRGYLQKMNQALGNDESKIANFAQMTEDVRSMTTAVGDLAEKFKLIKFDEKNGSFESMARIKESLEGINSSLLEIKGSMGVFGNAEQLKDATEKFAEAKKNLDEAGKNGEFEAGIERAKKSIGDLFGKYAQQYAEKITVGKLTRYYRKLIAEAPVDVFYCGSADPDAVERAVADALESLPRVISNGPVPDEVRLHAKDKPRYFREELDVAQGKLVLGFRLGETMRSPDYAALRLFNAVYGGCVTSKLFLNVREKLSLCYFASSRIDVSKGVMFVVSGIETENYQAALDEILLQLELCRQGEITDEEFESAKKYVITTLKAAGDSQYQLESYYFGLPADNLGCSPYEAAALTEHVTKEEITEIAKHAELDTVYFLTGREAKDSAAAGI